MLQRRPPAIMTAGYEFVALVVDQRQEQAHAVPLSDRLGVIISSQRIFSISSEYASGPSPRSSRGAK